jgi:hypothetical protein
VHSEFDECGGGSDYIPMAIQRWTICTIGGAAAEPVLEKFKRWHNRNLVIHESEDMEWDAASLAEMNRFVEMLRAHSAELPVVYFSEHVDMWDVAASNLSFLEKTSETWIVRADYAMACCRISTGNSASWIPKRAEGEDSEIGQEKTWFFAHLRHAMNAWNSVITEGAVVVIRECIGGPSPADEEVIKACREAPDWLM